MMALSPQFRFGIRPAYNQAEGSSPPSLQSSAIGMDSLDSKSRHRSSTRPDARCDGRSETSHGRRDQGAEDLPGRGGRGGSQNQDGLAPTLSTILAVGQRR